MLDKKDIIKFFKDNCNNKHSLYFYQISVKDDYCKFRDFRIITVIDETYHRIEVMEKNDFMNYWREIKKDEMAFIEKLILESIIKNTTEVKKKTHKI